LRLGHRRRETGGPLMLAAFQRALADLTASPDLCRAARADPALLPLRYRLTEKEARRLNAIVRSRGMDANCILYRANRLIPVALNCPRLCESLGDDLNRLLSLYWESEPTTNVHFLFEADRFCRFLAGLDELPEGSAEILEAEHKIIVARLAATREMAGRDAFAA
jgi:hypothetical protein